MSQLPPIEVPSLTRLSCGDIISSTSWNMKRHMTNVMRWRPLILGTLIHACIGAPYGWSVAAPLVARRIGMITKSGDLEWKITGCTIASSLAFLTMDVLQGFNKGLVSRIGARVAIILGGVFMMVGYGTLGWSVMTHSYHSTWQGDVDYYKMYLGFILIGISMSLCYLTTLQHAVLHLPSHQGLVSGVVVGGFGAGALLFAPLFERCVRFFALVPKIGGQEELELLHEGQSFLLPSIEEKAILPYLLPPLDAGEGYLPGTGYNGLTPSLWSIGLIYGMIIVISGFLLPKSKTTGDPVELKAKVIKKTRLFRNANFQRLTVFKIVGSVSITALLVTARSVCADAFASVFPEVVDSGFTSSYLMLLTLGSLTGRIVWSLLTDYYGPKWVFTCMMGTGALVHLSIPILLSYATSFTSLVGLYATLFNSLIAVTVAAGVFPSIVSYNALLFGQDKIHEVYGNITLVTCWAPVVGPQIMLTLRHVRTPSGSYIGLEFLTLASLHALGLYCNLTIEPELPIVASTASQTTRQNQVPMTTHGYHTRRSTTTKNDPHLGDVELVIR